MKLFCFFMSFLFVYVLANVKADHTKEVLVKTDYMKLVLVANNEIERAYYMNNVPFGGKSGANGLEYVIETIVGDTTFYKHFGKINSMIAVPDKMDISVDMDEKPSYDNLTKLKYYQSLVAWKIKNTLDIYYYPEVDDEQNIAFLEVDEDQKISSFVVAEDQSVDILEFDIDILELDKKQNFGDFDLTKLAQQRRTLTGLALKKILKSLCTTNKNEHPVHHVALLRICRFLGLYMSTQFPELYIKNIEVDSMNRTCILYNGTTSLVYRKNNDVWEQIWEDGKTQPLEEQLK
ncbi:uncharacterized protein LOC126844606 [Adelges cooleyi]|uniref:uncharacterized protein LOC126844606 n=1 Tax=Adelges cooleyi TaxID=133065 RepID=UPI0021804503|nr:uncharacterized protein LOC126844606 [Adelges cooleyi]